VGIPLDLADGTPTELNNPISQTNLFYDSSEPKKVPGTIDCPV
jgi:hypothetical protein